MPKEVKEDSLAVVVKGMFKLSFDKLAALVGENKSRIARWDDEENGRKSPETKKLLEILKTFDGDRAILFGNSLDLENRETIGRILSGSYNFREREVYLAGFLLGTSANGIRKSEIEANKVHFVKGFLDASTPEIVKGKPD